MARRLTTNSAIADASTAASSDASTVGTSYKTGIGSWNASIPV
jgi:hypothetical protein